jgi:cholest-4-en-3-one 26-monooxygenase
MTLDLDEIMTAPERFSSRAGTGVPKGGMPPSPEEREARGFDVDIATMDLPAHRRFRQPLNSHFSSPAATRVQDEIARITAELIAEIGPRGTAEVVGDLGGQLPTRLVFPILGVPEVDWDTLRRLTRMAQHADDEEYQVDGGARQTSLHSQSRLFQYMCGLIAERRARPTDDLASVIASLRIDGELMEETVAARAAMGVLVGGLETTRNAIVVGLLALMRNPDQAELLRADPSLGKSATEEILRWVTPSRNRLRVANQDYELHGQTIRKGEWVVMWTLAVNRDPAVYEDPHRFDITRNPNKHMSFGEGIHLCLGRHLARLEIRTMVTEFVKRFPDAHPIGELQWVAAPGATSLKRLDIEFTPTA